ncbi:hypothetical protein [Roseovarius sp. TE539]|uniref:hypothetical protein n=1 Tax=Roseovarius sp. TE539 TaxID=2249812 RepID=UPI0011BEA262|nr:hypothetical protein [Roseovarius sp. TE539]
MKRRIGLAGHAIMAALLCAAGPAAAETVRSKTYEATAERRTVTLNSDAGKSIRAEQVLIGMKRRDGNLIGDAELAQAVGFAERLACGERTVLVSLVLGVEDGLARYDVLCQSGG